MAQELSNADAAREAERIRTVYREYLPSVRGRWGPENPGNVAMYAERAAAIRALLDRHGFLPLAGRRILDVGCGTGAVLGWLGDLGAEPARCLGVDLLAERVAEARRRFPTLEFSTVDGSVLPVEDGSVDLALAFTLFSSILDPRLRRRIAHEMDRVVGATGAILWYDFRYPSPANPHVRGIGRRAIRHLFPAFAVTGHSLTVLPPLARRLGRFTRFAYPVLGAVPALRSHYLGLLRRRSRAVAHP